MICGVIEIWVPASDVPPSEVVATVFEAFTLTNGVWSTESSVAVSWLFTRTFGMFSERPSLTVSSARNTPLKFPGSSRTACPPVPVAAGSAA